MNTAKIVPCEVHRVGRILNVLGNSLGQKSVELPLPILKGSVNGAAEEVGAEVFEISTARHLAMGASSLSCLA